MKSACQGCDAALAADGEAYICSYECTWCAPCADGFKRVCPNCGGELAARPKRAVV